MDFLLLLRFQSTTHHPYIPLNLAVYCCIYNPFPSSCPFTSVCSSVLPVVSRDILFYLFWTYTFSNSIILILSPLPLFLELIICIKSPCRGCVSVPHASKYNENHRHAVSTSLVFTTPVLYQPLAFICVVNYSRPNK